MEIICNDEQNLFVFKGTEHVSCLGYSVVFKQCLELQRRIKKFNILPAGVSLAPILESEIGTLKQHEQYEDLIKILGTRKTGTWFDYDTPAKVRNILEQYRKEGGQLRLFYGDTKSGRDWLNEFDMVGRIGRSTGMMQIPLLIAESEYGGFGILDSCIVRILDAGTREELYRHKNYHQPDMEIRTTEGIASRLDGGKSPKLLSEMGLTHGVWVQEKHGEFANHANFKSYGKAAQYVAFMTGECCEEPQ